MNWYLIDQNNSFGTWVVDDKLCHRLFIQAKTENEALEKAWAMGCYWNGVADGRDCGCCGDRWYQGAQEITFPYEYGDDIVFNSIEDYAQYVADKYGWTEPDCRLFFNDGSVKEIFSEQ